ncbi:MAG: hypothetical protein U0514_02645 [Candidatus Andersenbacteria bacterium]
MAILGFGRKKETPPPPPEEGRANLAKQLRVGTPRPAASAPQVAPIAPVQPADDGSPIYQFQTTIQRDVRRGRGWYVGWSLFFAAAIGVNIWLHQYLGAVALTLLVVLLFVSATQRPKPITVSLYASGLTIGKQRYPWHEFVNFWILSEPPELNRLFLKRRTRVLSELAIELGDEQPLKIRDLLLPWLPEDPTREESRVDFMTRSLKL